MSIVVILALYILPSITTLPTVDEMQKDGDSKHLIRKEDQPEPNTSDTALIQNNLGVICERMKRLDKILTPMYEDPPENGGEECVRFSLDYEQACLDLLDFCKINKWEALKAAREMVETGGSKFLEVEIDDDTIEDRFKWDKGEVISLHIIRGRCIEHWHNLWKKDD